MWCDIPAPAVFGGSTYICDKTLDYNGHHFERFVCYNFSCSWYGDMVIEGTTPYEEIPIELFREHFHHNHLCHPGEDLRNCEICKHRYSLHSCTLHKSCYKKVEKPYNEHCEDWKWIGDKD